MRSLRPASLVAAALAIVALAGGTAVAGTSADGAAGQAHAAKKHRRHCDPNYRGRCLKPNVSDYDCAGGSGNGPYYVSGPFRVVGRDHYRLDADHDGTACE